MPRPCIFGCPPASRGILHVFPNQERFPEQFKAWLALVPENQRPPHNDFHNKRVCDRHFILRDRNRNNRLNALAVPTLHLPGRAAYDMPIEEVYSSSSQMCMSVDQPQKRNIEESDLCRAAYDMPIEEVYSSSSQMCMSVDQPQKRNIEESDLCSHNVALDHNYCVSRTITNQIKVSKKAPATANINKYRVYQSNIKNLRREIYRLRNSNKSLKSRLENAENLFQKSAFQKVVKTMTPAAQIFTGMQMKTAKHKKGRRYTLKEKILSLSLYKRSPKCYSFMFKTLTLPSEKSLKRLLSQIKLCPGTSNKLIFENLKQKVEDLNISDRLCCLIFDEMSIAPQIHYDSSKDELKGFVSLGKKNIANHALVFMIKGIKKQFKQPVAYYFTNSLNKFELKNIIIDIVKKIQETGLVILCTVCDQGTVNVSAINELINDTKEKFIRKNVEFKNRFFIIGKQKIIPLYDTPHLIKGLRNNLLTKDLMYVDYDDESKVKTIKWKYFHQLFLADKSRGELRLLQKLTEEHVVPEKIKKMRVKIAAQVFSHSVGVAADHLTARGYLTEECRTIIPFVLTIDNLFDSLNVNSYNIPNGKIYKGPIKKNSPHHELWGKALRMFKSIKFVKVDKHFNVIETAVPPTVKNFILTIEGFQQLYKILTEKYSFDAMLTRNINQDPLENFFGNIRSYGARNTAPNCISFEGAYKSLLLNNYNSPQSINANCESDGNDTLQNFEFFLRNKDPPPMNNPNVTDGTIPLTSFDFDSDMSDQGQSDYVCGWVLKKCLTNVVKTCKKCRSNLICTQAELSENSFIRAKEYFKNKSGLCYPNIKLKKCFKDIQKICTTLLKKDVPINGIRLRINMYSNLYVEFPFDCDVHMEDLRTYFIKISSNIIIYSWCRTINRILCGKITRTGDDDDDDEIKQLAKKYYLKHKYYNNNNK